MDLAEYVESVIDSEELPPGTHLGTKEELRQQTGVARATVNEAVRMLSDRRRIELRPGPGGGIFVAQSNSLVRFGRNLLTAEREPGYLDQVIAVRDHLEEMIVREATLHRTTDDVRELEACLTELREGREIAADFLNAIWTLHERIARVTPNTVLRTTYLGLMQSIREGVTSIRRTPDSDDSYLEQRIHVHAVLVETIAAGDVAKVEEAVRAHHQMGRPQK